ncbi:unnamed protein product [Didymodactylos carnosus]|uniref:Uncharacterized protein n=1 Tax=Didymodactylos carnosus TaxID=1234261 RepID=A0A814NDV0_9BILA|nr:unnamed protein product [Didymodactylos carnosus]CAF1236290.1 unnamed protein product [Didymodactylos carnosus]CAF3856408.1 unnamed protein product [Didymodactylos carnosus]CAF4043930.1 unnamed protein product [Didymodactylos carnosus]
MATANAQLTTDTAIRFEETADLATLFAEGEEGNGDPTENWNPRPPQQSGQKLNSFHSQLEYQSDNENNSENNSDCYIEDIFERPTTAARDVLSQGYGRVEQLCDDGNHESRYLQQQQGYGQRQRPQKEDNSDSGYPNQVISKESALPMQDDYDEDQIFQGQQYTHPGVVGSPQKKANKNYNKNKIFKNNHRQ